MLKRFVTALKWIATNLVSLFQKIITFKIFTKNIFFFDKVKSLNKKLTKETGFLLFALDYFVQALTFAIRLGKKAPFHDIRNS